MKKCFALWQWRSQESGKERGFFGKIFLHKGPLCCKKFFSAASLPKKHKGPPLCVFRKILPKSAEEQKKVSGSKISQNRYFLPKTVKKFC